MNKLIDHPYVIIIFMISVLFMLLLDLGIFNKKAHQINNREAIIWSTVWIGLAMAFSGLIYYVMGENSFAEFQSAYWIEKALSVDNLFVFILVFNFFEVPKKAEHKVLFWGVIGALIMRAIFIFLGATIIESTYIHFKLFHKPIEVNYVLTIFGFFLIYAGYKSWFTGADEATDDFSNNFAARLIYRYFSVSEHYDGTKFFTFQNGIKLATPLLIVISVIEFTDLIFAVDSIPAIFAVSKDPFILYTSNIFAILGLRSLYFILANFMGMFRYLKYGLALILGFIGFKMLFQPLFHINPTHSLFIVGSILILSVLFSLITPNAKDLK